MSTRKVTVNTNPVANHYAGPSEKIVEFSSPNGGGLISFWLHGNGTLTVDLYRMDETVTVRAPYVSLAWPPAPKSHAPKAGKPEPWCNHDPAAVTHGVCECGQVIYTLAQLRDGTGFREGARFIELPPQTGPAKAPGPCPNCHGEREWSGRPGIASCYFCGQES